MNYMQQLDASLAQAMQDPSCVYTATDASLPLEGKFQAISGALVCRGHEQLAQITRVSGRTTAPDAELFAISLGVLRCLREENIMRISVYTDSIASARRALDPSVHSGQSVSLAVCRGLDTWLSGDPERQVYFAAVPSKERWPFHTIVHDAVTNFPQVAYGSRPARVTLDRVRKDEVEKALDEWRQLFSKPSYRGHHFLTLTKDGKAISPTYFNLGPWLSEEENSQDPKQFARFCRCVLGHAPIGEYRERFFDQEGDDVRCACGKAFESRIHLLSKCERFKHTVATHPRGSMPGQVAQLTNFLTTNKEVFAFRTSQPSLGIG